MGKPTHLALHPFNRVPILRHDDFTVYETSAIVGYLEDTFPKPALQPKKVRDRAHMNQWISSVNSYYYPYMIYHVSHERIVFPRLGIASDEKVVAHALPKIEVGFQGSERQFAHGKEYLLGTELTLADFYLMPATFGLQLRPEGKVMYSEVSSVLSLAGNDGGSTVKRFAPRCRRAGRSSTQGNGPCRTGRNIESSPHVNPELGMIRLASPQSSWHAILTRGHPRRPREAAAERSRPHSQTGKGTPCRQSPQSPALNSPGSSGFRILQPLSMCASMRTTGPILGCCLGLGAGTYRAIEQWAPGLPWQVRHRRLSERTEAERRKRRRGSA